MSLNLGQFRKLRSLLSTRDSLDVAFFCARLLKGFGVDLVVAMQAQYLAAWGHRVRIYTLANDNFFAQDFARVGNISVTVLPPTQLESRLKNIVCDVAIAHTDPFFGLVLNSLPPYVTKIAWDYGEPPPELFPGEEAARRAQIEFRRANHYLFHKTVAISEFVKRDMRLEQAEVVYCGSDHLLLANLKYPKLSGRITELAIAKGYPPDCLKRPFLLCVSRLAPIYRNYKGTNDLAELSRLTGMPILLVGKSDSPDDVTHFKNQGLICLDNLSSEELLSAYLDCTACVSLSKWEGYNLPLVEAMILGRPAFALDLGAHPETGAQVAPDIPSLAALIKQQLASSDPYLPPPQLCSWRDNAQKLNNLLYETRLRHLAASLGESVKPFVRKLHSKTTLHRIRKLESKYTRTRFTYLKPEQIDLSILILSKDRVDLLQPCLESLQTALAGIQYEVLIGDTGSESATTEAYYKTLIHQVHYLGKYNFSSGNNDLARHARGKYLLLLNNDTEAILPSIKNIISALANPDNKIGVAGAKLVYPDFLIQHAGVYICPHEPYRYVGQHVYKNFGSADPHVLHSKIVPAVTGACLFTPKELFLRVGGLDTIYQEECQDIDYCFKLREQYGLHSYYCAESTWIHKEGRTRSVKESSNDRETFLERWKGFIDTYNLFSPY